MLTLSRLVPALGFVCGIALAVAADAPHRELRVTATAYNSVPEQTNAQPWVAAWGDRLANGMKVIAVSRDLLDLGLRRGSVVRIDGLKGEYVVLDKMHRRWERTIDVYMGDDVAAARRFGRRKVTIRWAGAHRARPAPPAVAAGPPASADSVVPEAEPR